MTTIDAHREQELRIQALGAALSRRDWHATERAYEVIRDKFYATSADDRLARVDASLARQLSESIARNAQLVAENEQLRKQVEDLNDDVRRIKVQRDNALLDMEQYMGRAERLAEALRSLRIDPTIYDVVSGQKVGSA